MCSLHMITDNYEVTIYSGRHKLHYSIFTINSSPLLSQDLKCGNLECVLEAKMLGKHNMSDEIIINDFINEENSAVIGVLGVD